MRNTTLRRRLARGLMTLTIPLAGVLAAATPALAQEAEEPGVLFLDFCDSTYVLFGSDQELEWTVTAGGTVYWPAGDGQQPAPGESGIAVVPADAGPIEVDFDGSPDSDWPQSHTWAGPPEECAALQDPTVTPPTCDAPGEIGIPETLVTVPPENPFPVTQTYTLDGLEVAPGSSHPVSPGTHAVTLSATQHGGVPGLDVFTVVVKTWELEVEAPECPGDGGDSEPGDGSDDGEGDGAGVPGDGAGDGGPEDGTGGPDTGAGAELAKTGAPAGLLAGAAVALLMLGGGLYAVGRRRVSGSAGSA